MSEKIKAEDILFPGVKPEDLGQSVDFDSPEVKKLIEETVRRQHEILNRYKGNPSDRDKIVFGPCE